MARSKSTTGGKGTRKNANPNAEAINAPVPAGAADPNDAKAVAAGATAAETASAERVTSAAHAAKVAPETRTLEVVKSEPRKHVVVPINLEDEIRRRAYEIYQQRGNTPGSESEDWLAAEREVQQRYRPQLHTA